MADVNPPPRKKQVPTKRRGVVRTEIESADRICLFLPIQSHRFGLTYKFSLSLSLMQSNGFYLTKNCLLVTLFFGNETEVVVQRLHGHFLQLRTNLWNFRNFCVHRTRIRFVKYVLHQSQDLLPIAVRGFCYDNIGRVQLQRILIPCYTV